MPKSLNYTKVTNQYYLKESDEYEYDGEEFEYEVEDEELFDAIVEIVVDEYFPDFCEKINDKIKNFIDECDLLDVLFDIYKEQLEDYFEDDAMDYFKDNKL